MRNIISWPRVDSLFAVIHKIIYHIHVIRFKCFFNCHYNWSDKLIFQSRNNTKQTFFSKALRLSTLEGVQMSKYEVAEWVNRSTESSKKKKLNKAIYQSIRLWFLDSTLRIHSSPCIFGCCLFKKVISKCTRLQTKRLVHQTQWYLPDKFSFLHSYYNVTVFTDVLNRPFLNVSGVSV